MKETVTKIEGGRLLTLIVRASFATLSFTDIRVSGCVSSRHHAKSYLGTASVIYKIRIFWIFMFWGIENCFFLTYLQNKLSSRTHNFRKYQYTCFYSFHSFFTFYFLLYFFYYADTMSTLRHSHWLHWHVSGYLLAMLTLCPCSHWLCWHPVSVVVDSVDTCFFRISSAAQVYY